MSMGPIIIIEVSSIIFGFTTLIIMSKARSRLSPGLIRQYIDNFSVCLAFIVVFSIWGFIRDLSIIRYNLDSYLRFPEIFFIVCVYLAFIIASYRVLSISHEFSFKEEGKRIEEIVKKSKK